MAVVKVSAPGRCGIIGNPTDGYGGTVISCSLTERAYAEVLPSDRLCVNVSGEETELQSKDDFRLKGDYFDIPRVALRHLQLTQAKLELRAWSDIPFRAGLAGSTAILAAVYAALAAFKRIEFHPHQLAETIRKVELDHLKNQCGYQDQYMAVFGGLNYMDFRTKEFYRTLSQEVYATVESLAHSCPSLPFVLAHTGVERISGTVLTPIRERWLEGEKQVRDGYERIAQLARLGKKALLESDWNELGRLMNTNHRIQQELDASGDANDALITTALEAGAEGAKLAGAGGGGTIIALATNPKPVIEALKNAGAEQIIFPKPTEGLTIDVNE